MTSPKASLYKHPYGLSVDFRYQIYGSFFSSNYRPRIPSWASLFEALGGWRRVKKRASERKHILPCCFTRLLFPFARREPASRRACFPYKHGTGYSWALSLCTSRCHWIESIWFINHNFVIIIKDLIYNFCYYPVSLRWSSTSQENSTADPTGKTSNTWLNVISVACRKMSSTLLESSWGRLCLNITG